MAATWRDVVGGTARWAVERGDALAMLRSIPDASVDAVVTDPPYELTAERPRVGFRHCLRWRLLHVQFPHFNDADPSRGERVNFAAVPGDGSLLNPSGGDGVYAWIGMPVGAVDFEIDADVGEPEVHDHREGAVRVADSELADVGDAQRVEFGGNLVLNLRGPADLAFCEGTCSCYRQLGAGRIGVPVLATFLAQSVVVPENGASPGADVAGNDVGTRDNAARGAGSPAGVMADATTELSAVLALDLRGRTFDLLPANGAEERYLVLEHGASPLVGAGARASGLPPEAKPLGVGHVAGATRRTLTLDKAVTHMLGSVARGGFMGKEWDGAGAAYSVPIWREALRVLKPGGHLLAFGGTRTSHRMVSAIEDAGFEIRDSVVWIHGQGFPKSLDCGGGRGTALKPAHEPLCLARRPLTGTVATNVLEWGTGAINVDGCRVSGSGGGTHCTNRDAAGRCLGHRNGGQSTENETFHGLDSAPAGRWPSNVTLSHIGPDADGNGGCRDVGTRRVRTGVLNPYTRSTTPPGYELGMAKTGASVTSTGYSQDGTETVPAWECVEGCAVRELDLQSGESRSTGGSGPASRDWRGNGHTVGANMAGATGGFGDIGGASRFFATFQPRDDEPGFLYQSKPSTAEREAGCEYLPLRRAHELVDREEGTAALNCPRTGAGRTSQGRRNHHPTVKSLALCKWLARLVCPPGGIVLDPFCGSGSVGAAAVLERFRFLGCDLDTDDGGEPAGYVDIARARIAYWDAAPEAVQETLFATAPAPATRTAESRGTTLAAQRAGQGCLFGEAPRAAGGRR